MTSECDFSFMVARVRMLGRDQTQSAWAERAPRERRGDAERRQENGGRMPKEWQENDKRSDGETNQTSSLVRGIKGTIYADRRTYRRDFTPLLRNFLMAWDQ